MTGAQNRGMVPIATKGQTMKLPVQTRSVDRENRIAAAQAAGVNPAFFGLSLSDILKGAKTGLGMLNNVVNG
jgi:hypothetical protein